MGSGVMTAVVNILPQRHYVLSGRELRNGLSLNESSVFDDDIWDLKPIIHQRHMRSRILNFSRLKTLNRLVFKEYMQQFIDPASDCVIWSESSIHQRWTHLVVFALWLDSEELVLSQVTGSDLSRFRAFIDSRQYSKERVRGILKGVDSLWTNRAQVRNGLIVDPKKLEGWAISTARKSHENRTPRIPKEFLTPLIQWALTISTEVGEDILAGFADYNDRNALRPLPWGQLSMAVDEWIEERRISRKPVPGNDGVVSLLQISRELGAHRKSIKVHLERFVMLADDVGIDERNLLPTPIRAQIDGKLWLPGICANPSVPFSGVSSVARLLQTACYILIAYQSGMRDSEIKHLQRGCLSVTRDEMGQPFKYRLTSLAFKGERDPHGVEATWVIGKAAANSIELLEKLAALSNRNYLFGRVKIQQGRMTNRTTEVLTSSSTNQNLVRFVAWVREWSRRNPESEMPEFPREMIDEHRLSTAQFRRTLAWFIAREPGGVVAGALQYRHLSIQIFEGYAGSSAAGFRAEVEAEEAIVRGEFMLGLVSDDEPLRFQGPASEESARRVARARTVAGYEGLTITDPLRVVRMFDLEGAVLYPGRYVTCAFDAGRARCIARNDSAKSKPSLEHCEPFRCSNVALTKENRAAWLQELEKLRLLREVATAHPPAILRDIERRESQIHSLLQSGEASNASDHRD